MTTTPAPSIDWAELSTQAVRNPKLINLGLGHPDPALLPVDAMLRASQTALSNLGSSALEYGANAGPAQLVAALRAHLAALGEGDIAADEIFITAGTSAGLDLLATLFLRPGDVLLAESPTYHLALRIFREHPVELAAVPGDDFGMDIDALAERVCHLKREGKTPRALYCVPTFNNPTGASLPVERRRALVELAAREGLLIFEDDVYRELAYDAPAPPSLWSIAPRGTVIRLGSFAKTLAPGLRLGFLTASAPIVKRIVGSGMLDSGGGLNHFTACCVAGLFANGDYAPQVQRLRSAYTRRRDAMLAALQTHAPSGCDWQTPGGGFFVWATLPAGVDSGALLEAAAANGVAFIPGNRFFADGFFGRRQHLRFAFTLYDEDAITRAVRTVGGLIRKRMDDLQLITKN